jgi:hypothetical protein
MHKINLYTWHQQRQLDYCPVHFVATSTPLTNESKLWILERLQGRFFLPKVLSLQNTEASPYFEDSEEAVLYELTWS